MNIGQLRNLVASFVQSHSPGVKLHVEHFNSLVNAASIRHFKRRLGLPERYQPGMPIPAEVAEITVKNAMDLKQFLVHRDVDNDGTMAFLNGKAAYPEGFCYPLGATHDHVHEGVTYRRNFDMVNELQWSDMTGSEVNKPDHFFPIMRFTRMGLNVEPRDITEVNFVYYRWPREGKLAVTVNNGVNVYDNVASIDLEWDEANMIDIAFMMLLDLGIVTEKQNIVAVADKVKTQGI